MRRASVTCSWLIGRSVQGRRGRSKRPSSFGMAAAERKLYMVCRLSLERNVLNAALAPSSWSSLASFWSTFAKNTRNRAALSSSGEEAASKPWLCGSATAGLMRRSTMKPPTSVLTWLGVYNWAVSSIANATARIGRGSVCAAAAMWLRQLCSMRVPSLTASDPDWYSALALLRTLEMEEASSGFSHAQPKWRMLPCSAMTERVSWRSSTFTAWSEGRCTGLGDDRERWRMENTLFSTEGEADMACFGPPLWGEMDSDMGMVWPRRGVVSFMGSSMVCRSAGSGRAGTPAGRCAVLSMGVGGGGGLSLPFSCEPALDASPCAPVREQNTCSALIAPIFTE
mmetsp:Transcript_40383/g.101647  ORF Transcript_40383/g.101647 Transcript_40383/m.101647 type:complete len:340 (-) Transcript_40383:4-1023(-)